MITHPRPLDVFVIEPGYDRRTQTLRLSAEIHPTLADATWLVDQTGSELGGCCVQARLRDFARFGQFVLDGGRIDGEETPISHCAGASIRD